MSQPCQCEPTTENAIFYMESVSLLIDYQMFLSDLVEFDILSPRTTSKASLLLDIVKSYLNLQQSRTCMSLP